MQQIVECVPNFSDGRRPEVYNSIADAIQAVPGAYVLDVSADPDHNRSVITFVGSPAAVEEGAYQAIARAAQLINMEEHEGEHPRIGATDVCPFVPVKGVTIEDCVNIAKRLGQRVGEDLGIAVYLYGEAATRPDRKKLSNIRRGQYEKWAEEVAEVPERKPDYGPALPKQWGATVIGVRPFLIAYNIYLNSDDVDVANKIARAVRFSSGGLRYIQALGFLVEGQAQVSMNLTDFSKTPIHRVQELVKREAERYGLTITRAELIGMMPQEAALDTAQWYLQIHDFRDDQILENKMEEALAADFTPYDFLAATAAGTPTPGGGSTAALAGALSAALTQMVGNLTVSRKKYAAVEEEIQSVLTKATRIEQELSKAITEDSEAFDQLMAAWKDTYSDEVEKAAAIEQATIRAGEVPMKVAQLSYQAAELAEKVVKYGNANAVTDGAAAAIMARAAVQIAALNVKVNATGLKDRSLARAWCKELDKLESNITDLVENVSETASARGEF